MKKLLPYLILFILAMLIWDATFDPYHMSLHIDDEQLDGPLGALVSAMVAGGGIIIGLVALVFVAIVLAVVFAGVGIVVFAAVVLVAIIVALALSPLMLPLLIPVAIIWYVASRNRSSQRDLKQHTV